MQTYEPMYEKLDVKYSLLEMASGKIWRPPPKKNFYLSLSCLSFPPQTTLSVWTEGLRMWFWSIYKNNLTFSLELFFKFLIRTIYYTFWCVPGSEKREMRQRADKSRNVTWLLMWGRCRFHPVGPARDTGADPELWVCSLASSARRWLAPALWFASWLTLQSVWGVLWSVARLFLARGIFTVSYTSEEVHKSVMQNEI